MITALNSTFTKLFTRFHTFHSLLLEKNIHEFDALIRDRCQFQNVSTFLQIDICGKVFEFKFSIFHWNMKSFLTCTLKDLTRYSHEVYYQHRLEKQVIVHCCAMFPTPFCE